MLQRLYRLPEYSELQKAGLLSSLLNVRWNVAAVQNGLCPDPVKTSLVPYRMAGQWLAKFNVVSIHFATRSMRKSSR
jgi:hypothetical protein